MNSERDWATKLSEGYMKVAVVLRSGGGVGDAFHTLCTEAEALERGRDVHRAICVAAEALVDGPGDEADELSVRLWEELWEGPLELDISGREEDVPVEFRTLGTLTLTPESTWTVLLDCLSDIYIVALEEHADRTAAGAAFDSWAGEIANT